MSEARKSVEQIVDEVIATNYDDADSADALRALLSTRSLNADDVHSLISAVIELDRAQRTLVDAVAEAIADRGSLAAAQLIRDTDPDDDLWSNYLGPMLDRLEYDYTKYTKASTA